MSHWTCYQCNGQSCSAVPIVRTDAPSMFCNGENYPPWDDQGDGKHLGCNDNNRCILVNGEQPSSCQTDAQCPHKYCEAGRCLLGVGGGPNECADDSECLDPAVTDPEHSECVDKKCKIVKGFEKDSCLVDTDCDGMYSSCKDNKCVQQEGFLPDSCGVDTDCYHSACTTDLKCKIVEGEDDDKCTIDADCQRTYLDCDNNQCVAVPGDAPDACAEDNDCVGDNDNDTTHLICNASQQCEVALGDGADQCQTPFDCISGSHNECSGQTCVSVLGAGINQCNTSVNCVGSPVVDDLGLGLGGGINAIDGCIEDRPGSMSVVLEWEYFSPEGIRQSQYVFQADDNSDFSSPEVNTFVGSLNNPSGTINSQTLLVNSVPTTPGAGFLAFNTTYHMRARVWDQNNRSSDWQEITYKTPVHAYPSPSFHPSLMPILVNEPVVFADGSLCYTSSQQVYFCKDLASNEYTWNFDGQIYSTRGSITHTYTDTGTYSVSLTICDSLDQCCQVSDDALSVFNDLGEAGFPEGGSGDFPLWKEISPF